MQNEGYRCDEFEEIAELINRRQHQVYLHSLIYYAYDENIIDDATWSRWALELEQLQEEYPLIALEQPLGKMFVGFEHSSGHTLDLENKHYLKVAWHLIQLNRRLNDGEA